MPEVDVNALAQALMGGAAVWAGIRMEIKFLWRDLNSHKHETKENLKEIQAKLEKRWP